VIRSIPVCAVLGLAVALASPAVADDDLVAEHIKAIGGADALAKIESLERKGTAELEGEFGQFEGGFHEAVVNGKKAYTSTDFGVFQSESGWSGGEKGWAVDPQQGLRDIDGDDLDRLKMSAGIDPIFALKEQYGAAAFKLAGEQELGDATYDAVEIVDTDLTFLLDKDTKLIAAMTVTAEDPNLGGEYTVVVSYDDYKEVEGVKLPHKTEIDISDGTMIITMTYDENTVNEGIDDELFEKPAE